MIRSVSFHRCIAVLTACWLGLTTPCQAVEPVTSIAVPRLQLMNEQARDQDDMCIWRDADQPQRSVIITSDKTAGFVFVYDLQGKLLQTIEVPKPGNIDLRQNVELGGRKMDLVVVNQRKGFQLVPFRFDPQTRMLERIDAEPLLTGPNYGGCLSHDRAEKKLYFFCTSEAGTVEQYELRLNQEGRATAERVRELHVGKCEGAVADDEQRVVFIADEAAGVWKVPANPQDDRAPELIAAVGEHGMTGDVEGLTIIRAPGKSACLIVSDQGSDHYLVYDVQPPHHFLGEFRIAGAAQTDGIDVVAEELGPDFPHGVFCCHTDLENKPILVTPWEDIARTLQLP